MSNNNSEFPLSLKNLVDYFEKHISQSDFSDLFEDDFISLIRFYKDHDEITKAINCCDISLSKYPGNVYLLLEKAQLLYSLRDFESSIDILENLLTVSPFDPEILITYAIIIGESGDVDQSMELFSRAKNYSNDFHDAINSHKINILFQNGYYQEAIDIFEEKHESSHVSELAVYSYIYSYENLGNPDKGTQFLLNHVKKSRDNYEAWTNLGNAYAANHDHQGAIEAFKVTLSLKPGEISIQYKLGQHLYEAGHFEQALENLEKCKENNYLPAQLNYFIGLTYGSLGYFDKAIEFLTAELKSYKYDSMCWYALGITQSKINQVSKAIFSFNKAINIDPDNDLFWIGLANLYIGTQDYQLALEAFLNALEIDDFNENTWLNYLSFLHKYIDTDVAINVATESMYLFYDFSELLYLAGGFYFEKNNFQKGQELIEKALSLNVEEIKESRYYDNVMNNAGIKELMKLSLN